MSRPTLSYRNIPDAVGPYTLIYFHPSNYASHGHFMLGVKWDNGISWI